MTAAATKKPERRKSAPVTRTEQFLVTCTKPPQDDRDLANTSGVLTVDYEGEAPVEATFDPHDDDTPNAILPVRSLVSSDTGIVLRTEDNHVWAFDFDDEEEDEEEDQQDDGGGGDDGDDGDAD